MTRGRALRCLLAGALLSPLATLPLLHGAAAAGLLALAPVLVVVATLLVGRYPGARALEALAMRSRRRPAVGRLRACRRLDGPTVPRGGLLVAASLAGRGPPSVGPLLT